jgi:hypothetical protein
MKVYLALAYAIPTVAGLLVFARYTDHTWSAASDLALFYCAGVVMPYVLARRSLRAFDAHGIPASSTLRAIAFYPVIAAGLTFLLGITMWGAALSR